jgi:hypothetical protein
MPNCAAFMLRVERLMRRMAPRLKRAWPADGIPLQTRAVVPTILSTDPPPGRQTPFWQTMSGLDAEPGEAKTKRRALFYGATACRSDVLMTAANAGFG